MPTESLIQAPYPGALEPDNVPQDLKELAEHLARHSVMRFTDATARDAALAAARLTAEAGMSAYVGGALTVYDGSAWRGLAEDTHDHAGLDSGARYGLLGVGGSGTNVTDSTTAFVSVVSVPVTIPAMHASRRMVVEAHARVGVSVVGNVLGAIFRDGVQVPGNNGRLTNPTVTSAYEYACWGVETATPPPGSYVYSLRFRNLAAGSWTFFDGDVTVELR